MLQRVRSASVTVDGETIASIAHGLVVLLGVAKGDSEADAAYMVDKIPHLRIFADEEGKMNRFDRRGQGRTADGFTIHAVGRGLIGAGVRDSMPPRRPTPRSGSMNPWRTPFASKVFPCKQASSVPTWS